MLECRVSSYQRLDDYILLHGEKEMKCGRKGREWGIVGNESLQCVGTEMKCTHINVSPYLCKVVPILSEPLVDSSDSPLAPTVIISYEVLAVLIDGIVGEMHTLLGLQGDSVNNT